MHTFRVPGILMVIASAVALWTVSGRDTEAPRVELPRVVAVAEITPGPGNVPDALAAVVDSQAAYYAAQQRQIDEYLAAEHARQLAEEAARRRPPVSTIGPEHVTRVQGGQYADAAECTRAHEGWYTANTGNGYYGAYQFLQSTWNTTVRAMGREDLVGVRPSDASPEDQDAAFWFLWGDGSGAGHWGYRCTEY